MDRSCLLCIGSKEMLSTLIKDRVHSGKRDFMKYVFAIPINNPVNESALLLTPQMKHIMPEKEVLHPGYCGEECRELLISKLYKILPYSDFKSSLRESQTDGTFKSSLRESQTDGTFKSSLRESQRDGAFKDGCETCKDLYVIVGIEEPGCGYYTYDIVFPQGRCNKGENSRDASMREFFEETGILLDYKKTPSFLGFVGGKKEMSVYFYLVE